MRHVFGLLSALVVLLTAYSAWAGCPSGYSRSGNKCVRYSCPAGYTQEGSRCVKYGCRPGCTYIGGGKCRCRR